MFAEIGEFTTRRSMLDSLRMEVSSISPSEAKRIGRIAGAIADTFISDYGRFMPRDVQRKRKAIEDRIIIMDEENLDNLWGDEQQTQNHFVGARFHAGNFIGILNPSARNEKMKKIYPDDWRKINEAIASYGYADPLGKFIDILLHNTIAHEEAHYFGTDFISMMAYYFAENGARYYASKIGEKLAGLAFYSESGLKRVQHHTQLIEQYGDDVHRLYFGGRVRRVAVDAIMRASYVPEIEENDIYKKMREL